MLNKLLSTSLLLSAISTPAFASDINTELKSANKSVSEKVIKWRRHLHQNPELSNREFETAKYVAKHLRSLGLEVQTGVAHTGVVAKLKGGKKGPLIALRADMDALPVKEQVDLPFASTQTAEYKGNTVGVMHACGHDNHVAILMAAAESLVKIKDQLAGDILFVFQPAEEGAPEGEEGGAELMLKEGLFKEKPEAVFGLHVTSSLNTGQIGFREGPLMASADKFTITVKGRQTHGSRPWNGVDPIVASSQIIMATQTIASRQVDVTKAPSVVSFGAINGGIRNNIIPDQVEMVGTIRTFDQEMRADIKKRLAKTAEMVAESGGAEAHVHIDHGYPVTVNDVELTKKMAPTLAGVVGKENLITTPLITGAEDFSYYALETPGMFFFLGVTPKGQDAVTAPSNHSPHFFADEKALQLGVNAMTQLVIDYLK
ncbi:MULTISPECIES: amidohydrolase [unclassified Pseudoalteromonas]|uniref:amidohydrolase n=1 Tax=Pseudoalteromonas TaxID=53246 RepID=UPI000C97EA72|nr:MULTISPECIES: amidohydrolase [unclassified Pseudoalteromonas]MAD04100.1 N-acyl-L-amino acid amidohydrolase [Pseudoalteromonas sp.]MCG9708991.1 amidohydrolase [Pseudoalteromonas sp. Isolate3]MCP4585114.1 amidohydrolase [Pseudoalteromonas sp.]RZD23040.1 amidohydrolase [Pseudoalteromonas sp. MEBiC 03485]URQ91794.1 amidohydrolase [Pseudoalteromonas sp. SCSIO 43101]|tara:strand:+ start:150 stop:1439 length:1290 start_codon:yes stop_codon:yes gene_type:complete